MAALQGNISLLALKAVEHWTPRGMIHSPLHAVCSVRLLMQKHPSAFCSLQLVNRASTQTDRCLVLLVVRVFFFSLSLSFSLILVTDQSQINNIWQLAHLLRGSTLQQSSECLTLILNGWLSGRIKWCLKKHTDIIIKDTPTLTGSWS